MTMNGRIALASARPASGGPVEAARSRFDRVRGLRGAVLRFAGMHLKDIVRDGARQRHRSGGEPGGRMTATVQCLPVTPPSRRCEKKRSGLHAVQRPAERMRFRSSP